ncbi:hypothetical protein [Nocardia asteroides]|uniref:hypothetical protein n=1 Tax=Nocardia asteroides TaxID=1824 RepID=UPI001E3E561C|nr:hypothetical protein [Nocardia asteroides]UGT62281.1 hypothetical protein LTT61_02740 [Nocardia asteroides]
MRVILPRKTSAVAEAAADHPIRVNSTRARISFGTGDARTARGADDGVNIHPGAPANS